MSQIHRISRNNTTTANHPDGSKSVTLHQTEVIRYYPERRKAVFNTGGWFTVTTRTRMNQACNEWNLPLSVSFNVKGNTVRDLGGNAYHFKGNVCEVSW